MDHLFALSEFPVVVVAAVVLSSVGIAKIVKVSLLTALAGIGAPLVLPLREFPVFQNFTEQPYEYLVGGAWVSALCCGLVWRLLRPVIITAVSSVGLLKCGYVALLGAAFVVAGLLLFHPQPLATSFPTWKGPAGMVLLAASVLGASRAIWHMLRATVLVALWGCVSLVLASSIFLDKLPHHIRRDDMTKIQAQISSELLDRALVELQALVTRGGGVLGLLRVRDNGVIARADRAERDLDA